MSKIESCKQNIVHQSEIERKKTLLSLNAAAHEKIIELLWCAATNKYGTELPIDRPAPSHWHPNHFRFGDFGSLFSSNIDVRRKRFESFLFRKFWCVAYVRVCVPCASVIYIEIVRKRYWRNTLRLSLLWTLPLGKAARSDFTTWRGAAVGPDCVTTTKIIGFLVTTTNRKHTTKSNSCESEASILDEHLVDVRCFYYFRFLLISKLAT